jgi:hypothetical protein
MKCCLRGILLFEAVMGMRVWYSQPISLSFYKEARHVEESFWCDAS